jgi:hypothetical protein
MKEYIVNTPSPMLVVKCGENRIHTNKKEAIRVAKKVKAFYPSTTVVVKYISEETILELL